MIAYNMIKATLQVRITTLMVLFSVLFIIVFTAIQARNQLTVMTSYNSYRSRLGAIIVKNTLESLLKDAMMRSDLSVLFRIAMESLAKENVVDKISIFDTEGNIITSNDPLYLSQKKIISSDLARSQRPKRRRNGSPLMWMKDLNLSTSSSRSTRTAKPDMSPR